MAATAAPAETYRIATYAAPLSRDGPGLLLRDLRKGGDAQIAAIADVIATVSPDVILLTDFDYDLDGRALWRFSRVLADAGARYDHQFAMRPNTGVPTGLDIDGDGYTGDARDAQGYGRFNGDGGMAILSRIPIDADHVDDLSGLLWRDLRGAVLPAVDGIPFLNQAVQDVQRLSTTGHWIVPFTPEGGKVFTLMAWSATPPVFDGPEDRNGLRNRDELRLWENTLDDADRAHFIVAGNANLDPLDGQGDAAAMAAFLGRSDIQDPKPRSAGALGAADADHRGDPALDTADWPDDGPGNLRVSYVLPSVDWQVADAGVFWPEGGLAAGAHHLVWVDIAR